MLRCFIFLVEKFLANGEFDKIKARLVANGAQQNRELYPNKSSPTASMHAIFTCFALVKVHTSRLRLRVLQFI